MVNGIEGLPDKICAQFTGWQAVVGKVFERSNARVSDILDIPAGGKPN